MKLILKLAVFILIMSLFGCSPKYIDGVYRAQMQYFDSLGYKEYIEITVTDDGKITNVVFNGFDAENDKKTDDEIYSSAMRLASKITPHQAFEKIIENYFASAEKNAKVSQIDAVTGATLSLQNFKLLFEAAQKNAILGDGNTAIVENLPETIS